MEMANPADAAPNVSSGKVYMLTLNAATAKMLSEMPADAHPGEAAHGSATVASETTPAARQTRKHAGGAATPRFTSRRGGQPPREPPHAAHTGGLPQHANTGGIQTYHAACWSVRRYTSTMYFEVQKNQKK